jgi:Xaa-Pro aminopeptidase
MKWMLFLLFGFNFGIGNLTPGEIQNRYTDQELDFFQSRRTDLLNKLPANSCAVFFSSSEKVHSNDIKHKYDPNRNLYYLTGYDEPGGVLFLFKNEIEIKGQKTREVFFVQRAVPSDRIWDGYVMGAKNAQLILNIPVVLHSDSLLETELHLENLNHIYVDLPEDVGADNPNKRDDLASILRHFESKLKANNLEPKKFELLEWISELRQSKNVLEVKAMKRAGELAENAQRMLMKSIHPGMMEYEAEAIVQFEIRKNGGQKLAFPSICGGGNNACTLHYSSNKDTLHDGDLILLDIGAQYNYYASDMTRTFPVNGKFSPEQRDLYTVVLSAFKKAKLKCKPGEKFKAPHDAAVSSIAQGLLKLGIIKEYKEVYNYYMHGTSHYVGLDVHDAGLYGSLKPNQVITIEPGVYIPEGSKCDKKWWGIGIRIEDVLLITSSGHENLTGDIPIEISDIEGLMVGRR